MKSRALTSAETSSVSPTRKELSLVSLFKAASILSQIELNIVVLEQLLSSLMIEVRNSASLESWSYLVVDANGEVEQQSLLIDSSVLRRDGGGDMDVGAVLIPSEEEEVGDGES